MITYFITDRVVLWLYGEPRQSSINIFGASSLQIRGTPTLATVTNEQYVSTKQCSSSCLSPNKESNETLICTKLKQKRDMDTEQSSSKQIPTTFLARQNEITSSPLPPPHPYTHTRSCIT